MPYLYKPNMNKPQFNLRKADFDILLQTLGTLQKYAKKSRMLIQQPSAIS